jgi:uncharacterized protein (TIGR02996 family)
LSTVATTDDEALLRAVLANPADEAPRLVYADWLEERGDPRGDYLRLDLELSKPGSEGPAVGKAMERAAELRSQIDPNWTVTVSRGFCDLVKVLEVTVYRSAGGPWHSTPTSGPMWSQVEEAFRKLDRCLRPFFWLFYSQGEDRADGDHLNVMGGEGAWCFDGSLAGEAKRFENPNPRQVEEVPVWTSDQGYSAPPRFVCEDEGTVIRAVKWAYYFGQFAPDVSWAVREW